MRTTMLLRDQVYRELRRVAADEGRTMTSLVEEALLQMLRERRQPSPAPPYVIEPISGQGLRPGVDLDDSGALADLMDPR